MQKNTWRSILTPIILALVLAGGIYAGAYILPGESEEKSEQTNQSSKIQALFQLIQENYVDKVPIDSLERVTMPVILEKLDPHSVYISPEQMKSVNEEMTGQFEGIGIQFNMSKDTVLVISTISGGPSEKVGILPGDRIVTINDSVFAGKNISTDEIMKNLKGPKGTVVKVGIKRNGMPELIHFEITRDKIPLYSVDVSYMINNETGYIKINRFSETTYDEFKDAAAELLDKGMKKIVLDLRQNGGGLLGPAVYIADEFLKQGKMIVYIKGQARKRQNYIAKTKGMLENIDVAVLTDTWSASASEIVAGALQDNDRGIIIGRRSFGKGLVQEPFTFRDGGVIRLTTARYYTPVGRSIQKPYDKGLEEYMHDIGDRMMNGELSDKDKADFPDSLKYTTKGGKTVYGGGGIMPDIFVPIDTTDYSDYYHKLTNSGHIYQFALNYADKNRQKLNEFESPENLSRYLSKNNVLKKFANYAKEKGIKYDETGFEKSKYKIQNFLHALIARNIMDSQGFYPIIAKTDHALKKAVKALNN